MKLILFFKHVCPVGFGKNIIFDFTYFVLLMNENLYALKRFVIEEDTKKPEQQEGKKFFLRELHD